MLGVFCISLSVSTFAKKNWRESLTLSVDFSLYYVSTKEYNGWVRSAISAVKLKGGGTRQRNIGFLCFPDIVLRCCPRPYLGVEAEGQAWGRWCHQRVKITGGFHS